MRGLRLQNSRQNTNPDRYRSRRLGHLGLPRTLRLRRKGDAHGHKLTGYNMELPRNRRQFVPKHFYCGG